MIHRCITLYELHRYGAHTILSLSCIEYRFDGEVVTMVSFWFVCMEKPLVVSTP